MMWSSINTFSSSGRSRSSREGKILDVAVVSVSVMLGLAFFADLFVSLVVSVVALLGL